ncbi:hypothetical protein [Asaia spathodeae]|uniref:Uncharacterized protein n=1 Tax=Asaia spathodeae TaxID=657016 RepID=A0ABX2P5F8_9PROT|nr:hypothetical protein [Asaia spathodeae]GBR11760.1 hypothetical protein AA105894_0301 [Asaia spathodeae NBRC 105894]
MKEHNDVGGAAGEVSITTTLVRTIGLVGLTLVLALLIRFVPFLSHGVQWVAGTSAWQRLYSLFGIDTSLGREQLILIGIMLCCFIVALGVQTALTYVMLRLKR